MEKCQKLIIFFLTLTVISCGGGGGGSSNNSCSVLNARIFNGDTCNQTSQTAVVALGVALTDGSKQVFCTGALVTVDDVLTSAHCLTQLLAISNQVTDFRVIVGGVDGEAIPVVNAAIHPQYNGVVASRYDVAMLTLAAVPSPPIGPLPILVSQITGPGSEITAFGYGTNEGGANGTLKAATFTITSIQDGNLIVSGSANDGASVCPGDSGGPAVYESKGVATLAGINSFIDTRGGACLTIAAQTFGFVDIQDPSTLNFISAYAPDVAPG